MPKLPPLSALRAFESAARLKSIGKAANELNVSHPAISHQIKRLEPYFGQPLLIKKGRGITTTKAGDRLSATLTETFEEIRATCSLIKQNRDHRMLVIASVASGAMAFTNAVSKTTGSHAGPLSSHVALISALTSAIVSISIFHS